MTQRSPDTGSWDRIEKIFLHAREIPDPAARAEYLRTSCGDDTALRGQVENLLSASSDADEFMSAMARRSGLPFAGDDRGDHLAGRLFGAYRLVRVIGRGGMGTVYLAERADEQFDKRVAVKLLPAGPATTAARQRFLAERRILAQLEHPGIARLLDAGLADDGSPYFVMEFVEGDTLIRHCDSRGLGVSERLQLFLQVCEAVRYAHGKLVIHRDLKPANILVTADGVVKLLDFGIARVLDDTGDATPPTMATRWGLRPMTPAYASPEQVRGELLSTASDVYSLGVLLYQLLSGRPAYDVSAVSAAEAEHIICEADPPLPSTAAAGGTASARLSRTLRGDLDTIIMAAMAKEAGRRYASAADLAGDIRHYLAGRPVTARRSSYGYRLRKFVRRRPGVVAAAGIALLLTLGYGATLQAHAARLELERNSARLEVERRERISEFLFSLFEGASPALGGSADLTARQLLERGAASLDRLAGDPLVESEVAQVLGDVYFRIGRYADAAVHLQRSVDLMQTAAAANGPGLADLLQRLALTRSNISEPEAAESALQQALQLRLTHFGAGSQEVAGSLDLLGSLYARWSRLDEAESMLRQALQLRLDLHGPSDGSLAATLANLGDVEWRRGNMVAALAQLEEAWRLSTTGENATVAEADLANRLGLMYRENGRFDEALDMYEHALAIRRRVYTDRHPSVATVQHNRGVLLRRMGLLDEAEAAGREALDIRIEFHGPDDPLVAQSLNSLGNLLRAQGKLDEARDRLQQALEIQRRQHGEENYVVATTLNNLANVMRDAGDFAEAEVAYRDALRITVAARGPQHPDVAATLFQLGVLYRMQGDGRAAERYLAEALDIRVAALGAEHPSVANTRAELERVRDL
jgi:eukaryotic-like serine/threonine-protein kinase